jgi:hypothetical protein
VSGKGLGEEERSFTLDLGKKRRNVLSKLRQRMLKSGAKPVSEHEIEELVHVLREGLSNRLSKHSDALEDRLLRRRSLLPPLLKPLLDARQDRVEIRRHRTLDLHRDMTDSVEGGGAVAVVLELAEKVKHRFVEVVGGEVRVVVAGESGNELDNGAADERVTVVLEGEDLVANFGEPIRHELKMRG